MPLPPHVVPAPGLDLVRGDSLRIGQRQLRERCAMQPQISCCPERLRIPVLSHLTFTGSRHDRLFDIAPTISSPGGLRSKRTVVALDRPLSQALFCPYFLPILLAESHNFHSLCRPCLTLLFTPSWRWTKTMSGPQPAVHSQLRCTVHRLVPITNQRPVLCRTELNVGQAVRRG